MELSRHILLVQVVGDTPFFLNDEASKQVSSFFFKSFRRHRKNKDPNP